MTPTDEVPYDLCGKCGERHEVEEWSDGPFLCPQCAAPTVEVRTDKPPTLEEAQAFVGGPVEALEVDGATLLVNENGRLLKLPFNEALLAHLPMAHFWHHMGVNLVGNVLILKGDAREEWS